MFRRARALGRRKPHAPHRPPSPPAGAPRRSRGPASVSGRPELLPRPGVALARRFEREFVSGREVKNAVEVGESDGVLPAARKQADARLFLAVCTPTRRAWPERTRLPLAFVRVACVASFLSGPPFCLVL